uniref:Uncharacterized protein n=1 Tax=Arundo donax TaxID=35708 RepID=A0A0A9CBF9_ARUDO
MGCWRFFYYQLLLSWKISHQDQKMKMVWYWLLGSGQ